MKQAFLLCSCAFTSSGKVICGWKVTWGPCYPVAAPGCRGSQHWAVPVCTGMDMQGLGFGFHFLHHLHLTKGINTNAFHFLFLIGLKKSFFFVWLKESGRKHKVFFPASGSTCRGSESPVTNRLTRARRVRRAAHREVRAASVRGPCVCF